MAFFKTGNPWKDRALACSMHLIGSLAVAGLAAALVFLVWYPYPYREISGGRELFFLIVAVDVVMGPLLTFAVFNHQKGWAHLRRDLVFIVLLQLAALAYGLWTVAVARPVHLVFEYDRFRAIHAIELEDSELAKAPPSMRNLPWAGPTPIGLRPLVGNESMAATVAALSGLHLALQAEFWQSYEASTASVLKFGKPMKELRIRFASQSSMINQAVQASGRSDSQLLWVPMVAKKGFWTVLVDAQNAQPLAYLPLDSF